MLRSNEDRIKQQRLLDSASRYKNKNFVAYPVKANIWQRIFNKLWLILLVMFLITVISIIISGFSILGELNHNRSYSEQVRFANLISNHDLYISRTCLENYPYDICPEKSRRVRHLYIADINGKEEKIWIDSALNERMSIFFPISYLFAPGLFLGVIFAGLARHIMEKTPKVFVRLIESRQLNPYNDHNEKNNSQRLLSGNVPDIIFFERPLLPNSAESFLDDYVSKLRHRFRDFFTVASVIFYGGLIYIVMATGKIVEVFQDGNWTEKLWIILAILYVLMILYAIGPVLYFMYLTSSYIRWLTHVFDIRVQPKHRDGCGGLKQVGDLCFDLTVTVLAPIILFGIWLAFFDLQEWFSSLQILIGGSLVIFLILSYLSFFAPMWNIHTKMLNQKRKFQNDEVNHVANAEAKLIHLYQIENYDKDVAEALESELSITKSFYEINGNYPEWPFSFNIGLRVYAVQLFGILSLIIDFLVTTQDIGW